MVLVDLRHVILLVALSLLLVLLHVLLLLLVRFVSVSIVRTRLPRKVIEILLS